MSRSRLGAQIGRVFGRGRVERPGPDTSVWAASSASAFEQVTRERVDGTSKQLDRLELKLNGVFIILVGAVIAEIYRVVSH